MTGWSVVLDDWSRHFWFSALLGSLAYYGTRIMLYSLYQWVNGQHSTTSAADNYIGLVAWRAALFFSWLSHVTLDFWWK